MRQLLQNLKSGKLELVETPAPAAKAGSIVIATKTTLISAGTEKMLVDFSRSGLLAKARQQPDKVKQVMEKVKTDGLIATLNAVQSRLDEPLPLGYCNTGVVVKTGRNISGFSNGDRVASNGPHAEIVCVPQNLCARIPDNVSDEEAVFTVLGAIALQGVRLAQPTLGESFTVIGLGLIGLITVQILQAGGCKVLGIDKNAERLKLAKTFGAETVDVSKDEDPVSAGFSFTDGRGIDGILITAATKSNTPVQQAARMSRKKGRIVLVGVTGLELNRADFYEKELNFQVSCSYGPGRYDPKYEEKGQDYPLGYVRWTEQRNFDAVLGLMASGKLDVKPLITHRFQFAEATKAYDMLAEEREAYLGILLQYPGADLEGINQKKVVIREALPVSAEVVGRKNGQSVIGMVGAGNFTKQVLLPVLKETDVSFKLIASSGGVSAATLGTKFGFEEATSDPEEILSSNTVNTVFITTRHNTHAWFVKESLRAGKHVFVEKPLCIKEQELNEIKELYCELNRQGGSLPLLMVGFNRRFSLFTQKMKDLLDGIKEPKTFILTVNAGQIPADHWIQDPAVGGGRIVGEACHFIDLLRFLTGQPVVDVKAVSMDNSRDGMNEDKVSFTLAFADGSMGTVHYFANGHRSFPKERLDVFCGGRILALDNFRKLAGYGWPGFRGMRSWKQDKGHEAEIRTFINAVKGGNLSPISFNELVEVTRISFEVARQVK